ncbi:unnamed protein product [Blepharisma stoltei]|uniref:Helicase ATP-binding domain-containing protein n=1 Tax=Blepharisma stoltei TaxID=1481888 RepID=A0AAU9JNL4_9CILI|nr:unnamed protein product [Blepharisma stoltei]
MERDFAFPFEPYSIQLDFMNRLYDTLDTCKAGIFESPTGTGKSLSIICAAFKWLRENQASSSDSQRTSYSNSQAWLREIDAAEKDNRIKEAKASSEATIQPTKKALKKSPSDTIHSNLIPENLLLINESSNEDSKLSSKNVEMIPIPSFVPPRILYTSRTHSQLDQFIGEIKRTKWGHGDDKIRVIRIGSRNHLCINEHLSKYKKSGAINYKCKELIDPDNTRSECVWHQGQNKVSEFALSNVSDIEDLIRYGQENIGCPYYGTRSSLNSAEVIVAPYASILNKQVREGIGICLDNVILIVDEAHNLIESIIDSYSATLTRNQIEQSLRNLSNYFNRYQNRMSPRSTMYIKQILKILVSLGDFMNARIRAKISHVTPVAEFLVERELVDYDFYRIIDFVEEIELTRKLTGFAENLDFSPSDSACFHYFMEFVRCFGTDPKDSRILFEFEENLPVIKYLLLNPKIPFQTMLNEARCVILAGGTIEPIDEFMQLFSDTPREKIGRFSCGHVIPKENLLVSIVSYGESGNPFKFNYQSRDNDIMLTDLCKLILDVSLTVPHGVVVFLPSFAFLSKLKTYLQDHNYFPQIQANKTLFFDNRNENNMLDQYSREAKIGGAILFAVVRGKLSEGINFNDDLGRCVIMVGLPYLNVNDLEVKEKMRFLDSKRGDFNGRKFYEMNCHKAINQSIGRAIRHRNDYAVILLVDQRHNMAKRPLWMRSNCLERIERAKEVVNCIRGFFENKKVLQIIK